MKPQDILILLKIISLENKPWSQITLASELFMSQSEVSQSIARSKFAGLLHVSGKLEFTVSLMEFLQYGIRFVFPQRPGNTFEILFCFKAVNLINFFSRKVYNNYLFCPDENFYCFSLICYYQFHTSCFIDFRNSQTLSPV